MLMFKNIVKRYIHNPIVNFKSESNAKNLINFITEEDSKSKLPSGNHIELKKLGVTKVYSNKKTTFVKIPQINLKDKEEYKDLLKQYTSKALASITDKDKEIDIEICKTVDVETNKRILNYLILSQYKFSKASKLVDNKDTKESKENKKISEEDKSDNKSYVFNLINSAHIKKELENQLKYSFSTIESRELTNTRANIATPDYLFEYCKKLVKDLKENKSDVKLTFLKGQDLEKEGYNLIYNVGKANTIKPYIICLEYHGNKESNKISHAIVGKGLTFDTGGLNLKTGAGMETMFYDKHGACSVISAFRGIVNLKPHLNIVCAIGVAENSVDATSYRPSDILTSKKGLTVEIGNTDAEGRLVLADTFTFVQDKYSPEYLIDLATLTGACQVALGKNLNGLFSNDDKLASKLISSAAEVDEEMWRLPINDYHRDEIKSQFADINNKGNTPYGGASHGAAFLEKFINKNVKWAHIDLSAAYSAKQNGIYSAGATGTGAQTIMNYILSKH